MKKVLAAIFALTVIGANLSMAAFANEPNSDIPAETSAAVEPVEEETVPETITTSENAEEEPKTETETTTTSETDEDETETETSKVTEDTEIVKDTAGPVITEGSTFTIGDESFTASIEDHKLKIYNSKGSLAFSKDIYNFPPEVKSVALSVNGNALTVSEYDDYNRLLYKNVYEYNAANDNFAEDKDAHDNGNKWNFSFAGKSFTAVKTRETKERPSSQRDWMEYDQYNYLSINFADGTPTSIQNELVWVEYDRTGGFGGYGILPHIIIEGDKLTVRRIIDSVDSSKDTLTTYTFDEASNNFVKSGSTQNSTNNPGNNSNGNKTAASSSPDTSDSPALPAVLAATLIVGSAVVVSVKNKAR